MAEPSKDKLVRIAAFRARAVAEGPVYDVDALAYFAEVDGEWLVAEVRRLRAENAQLRETLEAISDDDEGRSWVALQASAALDELARVQPASPVGPHPAAPPARLPDA